LNEWIQKTHYHHLKRAILSPINSAFLTPLVKDLVSAMRLAFFAQTGEGDAGIFDKVF
jgi:hypothetical protein